MTEEEIKRIAAEAADQAARRAIREALTAIGINADEPFEVQEQPNFLRTLRSAVNTAARQALTAIIGFASVGVAWAVWFQIGGDK